VEVSEKELLRIIWRLDALDHWRNGVDSRLAGIEKQLAELVKSDEIAEAVADKMTSQQSLLLSRNQRHWAVAFGIVASLGSVGGIAALVLTATGHAG
jgi:hypothetical protein